LSTTLFLSSPSENKSFTIARFFHGSNYFGISWIESIFGFTLFHYTSRGSGESMQQFDIEDIDKPEIDKK
jgi:hypothetical protein